MGCFQEHYCNPVSYNGKFFHQMLLLNKTVSMTEVQAGLTVVLPGLLHSLQVTSSAELNIKLTWGQNIGEYFCKEVHTVSLGCNKGTSHHFCTIKVDKAFTSFSRCTRFIADIRRPVLLEEEKLVMHQNMKFYFLKCLGKDHVFTSGQWKDYYKFYHKTPHGTCQKPAYEPRPFSWMHALDMCRDMKHTLPTFLSRTEQEDFIMSIKNFPELFPMEAVFLGLRQRRGVSTFQRGTECKIP